MDANRRFSEREVALVLRKATEMEEHEAPAGSGLSLAELEQIATEVGISPAMIRRAVAELEAKGPTKTLRGASLSHEAIRAVSGALGPEGVAALVAAVERESDQVGEVSQALGTTRWTARDRFRTTQVAITTGGKEGGTTVRVVERASARLKRLFHILPVAWGGALGVFAASIMAPTDPAVFGAMVGGGVLGAVAGRLGWTRSASARAARVEKLAAELALEAGAAAQAGDAGGDGGPGEG